MYKSRVLFDACVSIVGMGLHCFPGKCLFNLCSFPSNVQRCMIDVHVSPVWSSFKRLFSGIPKTTEFPEMDVYFARSLGIMHTRDSVMSQSSHPWSIFLCLSLIHKSCNNLWKLKWFLSSFINELPRLSTITSS